MIDHAISIVSGDKKVHLRLWLRICQSIFHLILDQILTSTISGILLCDKWALYLLCFRLNHLGNLRYDHRCTHCFLSCRLLVLLLEKQIEAATADPPQRASRIVNIFNVLIIENVFMRLFLMLVSMFYIFQVGASVCCEYMRRLEKCTLWHLLSNYWVQRLHNNIIDIVLFLIFLGLRLWGQK